MWTWLLTAALAGSPAEDLALLQAWLDERPLPEVHPAEARGYGFARAHLGRVAAAATLKPGPITVEHLGDSAWGQPIFAVHVLEPGCTPQRDVLVFAGIHALEWISVEVAAALLDELVALPPCDVSVTVIPVLNPDGRQKVEDDLVAGENIYRRGNGAEPPVDLNRDFAAHREPVAVWRHLPVLDGYYSTSPEALSQPESRALDALAARERYDRAVSLHAFGGYHYFPWSGSYERPDDWGELHALGRQMQRAQGDHAYRPRQLGRWGFFFRAHGTEIDHLYAEYGTHAFLMELTRSGFDPRRPWHSRRTVFRWYNPVRAEPHVARGLAAVRALIRADGSPRGGR